MNHHAPQLFIRLLIITLCLALTAGCAGTGRYTKTPKVSLTDIQIQEIKTLETAFQIELRVLNPNDIPLEVSGMECDLKIDGKDFAAGVTGDHHVIPAYGSAIIPVTVYASVLDMVSSVISLVQGSSVKTNTPESLRYELSGHIRLGGKNVMKKTVPFDTKGELSLVGIR